MRPLDDVEPLIVAESHGRTKWLLRNDIRQDDMLVRQLEPEPFGKKLRCVACDYRTSAGFVCRQRFVRRCDANFLIPYVVRSKIIAKIEHACSVALDTHQSTIKL